LIFFLALAADERPGVFRPTRDFKGTAQNEGPPGARARADELGSCFAHRHGTLRFAVLTGATLPYSTLLHFPLNYKCSCKDRVDGTRSMRL
jgi:hypothetical protein